MFDRHALESKTLSSLLKMCFNVRSPLPMARKLRWREKSQTLLLLPLAAVDLVSDGHVPMFEALEHGAAWIRNDCIDH